MPPQYVRIDIFESAPAEWRIRETNMAETTQVDPKHVDAKLDVKKLSFERAIEELESIVTRLEAGKVPLEEYVAI